jgi:hypothetical protein
MIAMMLSFTDRAVKVTKNNGLHIGLCHPTIQALVEALRVLRHFRRVLLVIIASCLSKRLASCYCLQDVRARRLQR